MVAVDFDALLMFPDPKKQVWLDRLARFPRLARRLQPVTLRWFPVSRDAEIFFYWLLDMGFQTAVIVRRPYAPYLPRYGTLLDAVHAVLEDFPSQRFHLVTAADSYGQAKEINSFCRTHGAGRFYLADPDLYGHLPNSLTRMVESWGSMEGL